MELIRYWRVMRRWAWLIVLCTLVAVLAAGLISLQLPKIYEAKATLLVRPAQPLSVDLGAAGLTTDQILRTYARLMTERPMLDQVISEEGLKTDPTRLSRDITVTPAVNASILDVAVRNADPASARDTANTLVDDFIAKIKVIQQSEANSKTANSADNLVIWTRAIQPIDPIWPRPLLNIGLGLLA